jgi:hypothetical protein
MQKPRASRHNYMYWIVGHSTHVPDKGIIYFFSLWLLQRAVLPSYPIAWPLSPNLTINTERCIIASKYGKDISLLVDSVRLAYYLNTPNSAFEPQAYVNLIMAFPVSSQYEHEQATSLVPQCRPRINLKRPYS